MGVNMGKPRPDGGELRKRGLGFSLYSISINAAQVRNHVKFETFRFPKLFC